MQIPHMLSLRCRFEVLVVDASVVDSRSLEACLFVGFGVLPPRRSFADGHPYENHVLHLSCSSHLLMFIILTAASKAGRGSSLVKKSPLCSLVSLCSNTMSPNCLRMRSFSLRPSSVSSSSV